MTSSLCVQFMYWFCMLYKQGLKAGYLCSDQHKYHGRVSEIISLLSSTKTYLQEQHFFCKLHTIQCLLSHIFLFKLLWMLQN